MKLVEILAQVLEEWPQKQEFAWQDDDGEVRFNNSRASDFFAGHMATDNIRALGESYPKNGVTKEAWKSARAAYLSSIQPECDADIKRVVESTKKLPYAFTEADIRAAFAAGANWVRGTIEDGAAEYVEKLKGHK